MAKQRVVLPDIGVEELRRAIRQEYAEVALDPGKGFHFYTGRPLAGMLGYPEAWVDLLPPQAVESFAGTGNPFSMGPIRPGERVADVGCGAGFDSLIAAHLVEPTGYVIGVAMTPEMLDKAHAAARHMGFTHMEFLHGYAEALPVPDSAKQDISLWSG